MPAPSGSEQANGTATSQSQGMENGNTQSKATSASSVAASEAKPELSNAEKKKLQKEEKAARRAKDKGGQPSVASSETKSDVASGPKTNHLQKPQKPQNSKTPEAPAPRKRNESSAAQTSGSVRLPLRLSATERSKAPNTISFFAHLQRQPRKRTCEGTPKEVHPAIAQLALHSSSYTICGSHARGVAMLLAFKSLVQAYTTPHGTSLTRHFVSHYLPPQIEHLKLARPLSTTQANSIRWLKNVIAKIDPSAPEDEAKKDICSVIDTFISEKFTIADQVIAKSASDSIQDGDVIVTFGNSAVVRSALLNAAACGTRFRVVALDTRPLFEGRSLASRLSSAGIDVQYSLLHGVDQALRDVTKCFLGAHTILANGKLQSRAGTALLAMMAKRRHVSIAVCAETIKFSERAGLDSVVVNELAPEDELIQGLESDAGISAEATSQDTGKDSKNKSNTSTSGNDDKAALSPGQKLLRTWRGSDRLQLLNAMYDVTPVDYMDTIITELGSLPPASAPAVQRLSGDVE